MRGSRTHLECFLCIGIAISIAFTKQDARRVPERGGNAFPVAPETLCPLPIILFERSKFRRPVARTQSEDQAAIRHHVGRHCRLCHMQGVPQRRDDRPGHQCNVTRMRRQRAQVHPRVEVAERIGIAGPVERNVADPQGGETEAVGQRRVAELLGRIGCLHCVVGHRHDDPDRQSVRAEQAVKGRVGRAGAHGLCGKDLFSIR
jgi:hypothetical protein